MKLKSVLLATLFIAFGVIAKAQKFTPDIEDEHLKGNVKSVLTTVRSPQGRIIGQPTRKNFNTAGNYSRTTYYDTMGNPVIIVNFTYDEKNRLIKDVRTQEPYSTPVSQTTYSYDKKAKTITADVFGIADSLSEKSIYTFDKNNVLLKVITYSEDNKEISSISYEYNKLGEMTFATYTEGENSIYKGSEKYRYDTDGFLAEKCSYYLTTLRQAFLYTYQYDEKGNWINAYVFHVSPTEGYLYQIITRQISYYE